MLLAHPILKRIEVDGGERHTEKEKVKKKKINNRYTEKLERDL